tara:strand:- start:241 stop:372 length:132 start_codon:yes stop_codon:yes gene_type:complete
MPEMLNNGYTLQVNTDGKGVPMSANKHRSVAVKTLYDNNYSPV